jgi:CubicO group peptidase (beta-lactamase class C family)
MTKYFTLLLLLIIAATNVSGQNKQKDLDNFFSALFNNEQFNGNVLVAENGEIIYEKAFGYADFSNKRANTLSSSFPIASITKTFTSTAILQLTERGKLQLQDRVVKYLPDFPYPSVTIRHLLSHTAGLPIYDTLFFSFIPNSPDTVFTNKDIIPACISKKAKLIFQPGEDFSYNNVNYNILALIIETISGLPFGDYLEKYIFKPVGMTNTTLSKYNKREDKTLSMMYRPKYFYSSDMERADTLSEFRIMLRFNMQGHGDAISTARDLLKYDKALANGTLLNDTTLRKAFIPVKLNNGKHNVQRYALGWITREDTSMGEIVHHDGGLPGGRTIFLRNVTRHQTIILFDNTSNNVVPIADNALSLLNGLPVVKPKKSGAKFYGISLDRHGLKAGKITLEKIRKDTVSYYLSEDEMNSLGYAFLSNNNNLAAEAVFKVNTQLFPASWNTYDSYGEILLINGKKQEAIKMYRRSLEVNPDNQNGKNVLAQVLKQ